MQPQPYEVEQSIPARFEQVVARHASNIALGSGDWQSTYLELNTAANRLAHVLISHGGAVGDRVALLLKHDTPLITVVLAALKAGRVIVVLNPTDPPVRLREILEDTLAAAIIADREHANLASTVAACGQTILVYEDHINSGPADNPAISIEPGAAAFLTYTSGTTGRPKGVVKTHRNVLHNAFRVSKGMEIGPQDRVLLLGALSGGQGILMTWCALLTGAMLCPFPVKEKGVTGLAEWMREMGISIYVSSASLFRYFMKTLKETERLACVRLLALLSEPATGDDFVQFKHHFSNECVLFIALSSTETGNITQLRLTADDRVPEGRLPVGTAAEGVEVVLLGVDGQPVPPGETGEIVVRSRYLSAGYWRNDALTAARFSEWGHEEPVARVFRTGDLGRFDPHGRLIYLGRRDHQVKIRGYRIELSEIEAALHQLDEVDDTVVSTRAMDDGANLLIAYVVPKTGCILSSQFLRGALRRILPDYMVPSIFTVLEELPLNAHGKIDRDALSKIVQPISEERDQIDDVPQAATQAILGRIWAQAFGRTTVTGDDNFFDLGGDSLMAMVISASVYAELNVDLKLQIFADHPTLSRMAQAIEGMLRDDSALAAGEIQPVSRDGPLSLSFVQERVWLESRTAEGSAGHFMKNAYRLLGPLDPKIMRDCMNYIAKRHEILRTTFPEINGKPCQKVHPYRPVDIPYLDYSASPNPERQAYEFFSQLSGRLLNLDTGPLILFWLLRLSTNEHWLLRVNHHIISDAWSWKVYFRELGQLYEARKRGHPPPLPDYEPVQYADFAAWQRARLSADGQIYKLCLSWWREKLSDSPASLSLPFRRIWAIRGVPPERGVKYWSLPTDVTRRLQELGRSRNITFFVIRLAIFVALIAAETRQKELVIGTYVTNRNRIAWQNMFGFFADLVILRFSYDESLTLESWLEVVRDVLSEAEAHSEIPFQTLCNELRSHGVEPPEITALFNVSSDFDTMRFADVELNRIERQFDRMPWGFTLEFDLRHRQRPLGAMFDAGIHAPDKVDRFIMHYRRLLTLGSLFPGQPLVHLTRLAQDNGAHKEVGGHLLKFFRNTFSLFGKQ